MALPASRQAGFRHSALPTPTIVGAFSAAKLRFWRLDWRKNGSHNKSPRPNSNSFLEERNQREGIKWSVRIGIHSGPITAGGIGKKKFSYDLFGDTINVAARIESASEPGKINVSAYTYTLIKDHFPCTYRTKIDAKGKGELDMYFVD